MIDKITELDFAINDFIRDVFSCGFLDVVMKFITFLGNAGWLWIVLAAVLLFFPKTRKCGIMMGCALILSFLIGNLTLKPIVNRQRPFDLRDIYLIVKKPTDASFPSGHTMASFSAALAIRFNFRKWGIAALVLAGLIAFSRLYLYVHFPSDVICGVLLGCLYALAAKFITEAILHRLDKRNNSTL